MKPHGDGVVLLAAIRDTHQRLRDRQLRIDVPSHGDVAPPAPPRRVGKRVAIFGAKGGVGRTLVAVSVALGLRKLTKQSVVLMDADFLFGDLHFNLTNERNIIDLLPHAKRWIQNWWTRSSASTPAVYLLSRPPRPEQADAIKDGVGSIALLRRPHAGGADMADVYVVVTAPHLGGLRNTRHFLEIAKRLGYSEDGWVSCSIEPTLRPTWP